MAFVRLKLRIMRNGFRGKGWRIALFIVGILGGCWAMLVGFALFAAGSFAEPGARAVYAALAGSGLVAAWVFLPLLFFGVDETLDPARFALLPLRRRTVVRGMLAAALVGIPPVVTFVASLGSVLGAAVKGGAGPAVVAVLGAVVGLLLCVAASRAVTSAFATMLRSRRVRDLAALLIALLAILCGPAQNLFWAFVAQGDTGQARGVARVLSWTPLGAPYVAYADAIAGDWALVPLRLAIGLAGVALLLWWWTRTIESAMLGAASTSSGTPKPAVPLRLFGRPPRTRFEALLARELKYWWRHPRRRAGLISLLAASVVIPFGLRIGTGGGSSGGLPLPIGMVFAGVFVGLALANQFGTDGTAYSLHVLTGVPGAVELRSRTAGLIVLTLPLICLGGIGAAWLTHVLDELPASLGIGMAALGVSAGTAGLTSVVAAYALPESTNPFAFNSGGSTVKSLLSFVSMFVALTLVTPLIIGYFALPAGLRWLLLPLGAAWGLAGCLLGALAGGAVVDRRAPELLEAVTPRRT
jgi:ABC-2 type transport system permease protein